MLFIWGMLSDLSAVPFSQSPSLHADHWSARDAFVSGFSLFNDRRFRRFASMTQKVICFNNSKNVDNIVKIDKKNEIFRMNHSQHFFFCHIRFWKNYFPFSSAFDHSKIFSRNFFCSIVSAIHHVNFMNLFFDFFMDVRCCKSRDVFFNFGIICRLKSNVFDFDSFVKGVY